MLTTEEKISLKNLGQGAVIDKFDAAFENVLRDIIDLNTSEKVRTITIKAKIAPDEARSLIGIEVTSDIKKPGEKPFVTGALIGVDRKGKPYAQEIARQQQPLPFGSKVIDINKT